jgi:hypothetical protein
MHAFYFMCCGKGDAGACLCPDDQFVLSVMRLPHTF